MTPASTTSPSTTNVSEHSTSGGPKGASNFCTSVQAFSRSSSYTSLSSCDLKSTYSSVQSEYTSGFHTPYSTAAYSELPDSPGDQVDFFASNSSSSNNHNNNNSSNNKARQASQKPDELSMITIDSNPSRSNDITIIERTLLAHSSSCLLNQHSSTHSSGATSKQPNLRHSQKSSSHKHTNRNSKDIHTFISYKRFGLEQSLPF